VNGERTYARKRVALAGVVAVVGQLVVISQVPPFSGSADIVPLATLSIGLMLGSLPGAVFGFAAGLACDLLLVQPLGEYALLGLGIGYAAGRVGELRPPATRLALVPLGAIAAAAATVGFGLLQIIFGAGASLSLVVVQQAMLSILWGAILAIPVDLLMRRVVGGPPSVDAPSSSRRRAYATGGLSPLSPGRKR